MLSVEPNSRKFHTEQFTIFQQVIITNRGGEFADRLDGAMVSLLKAGNIVASQNVTTPAGATATLNFADVPEIFEISIKPRASGLPLDLVEVQVFGYLGDEDAPDLQVM